MAHAPESRGGETATPLASVAMITFNHAPFIAEAISSILAQRTGFRFELVIGDDCSTDGTSDVVDALAAEHPGVIRVLRPAGNRGAQANLLAVEAACRGAYIAYCEGDDYWHDSLKLQSQIAFLESHPDYAFTHSDFRTELATRPRSPSPSTLGPRPSLDPTLSYEEILTQVRIVQTLTVTTRAAMIRLIHRTCPEVADPTLPLGDAQRWLELSRLGKVHYDPTPLATRRLLPESASQSRDGLKRLSFIRACGTLYYHYTRKYQCSPGAAAVTNELWCRCALSAARRLGDRVQTESVWRDCIERGMKPRIIDWLFRLGGQGQVFRIATALPVKAALWARQRRARGETESIPPAAWTEPVTHLRR